MRRDAEQRGLNLVVEIPSAWWNGCGWESAWRSAWCSGRCLPELLHGVEGSPTGCHHEPSANGQEYQGLEQQEAEAQR